MPDNKLTDAEIVKALERCGDEEGLNWCVDCPYYDKENDLCQEDLHRDALDLINRLQAEKQDLEIELKAMRGAANSYKAENERLRENLNIELENFATEYDNKIKAEAYKEFAERLRFEIVNKPSEFKASQATVDFLSGHAHRHHETLDILDNLLKELAGEDQ